MQTIPLWQMPVPGIGTQWDTHSPAIVAAGDALNLLQTLPDDSVQLVVTSPPYNLGKVYEARTSLESYLDEHRVLIEEMVRILRLQGSLCWQVGNYVEAGEVFPLDILFYPLFKAHGLRMRNRIIWHFGHGLHTQKRFSGRYETLLWFTKTDNYTFHLDPVRVPSKYPGKRHYRGPNKGKPSGNPKGKNPSDVWEILLEDWQSCLWDIPNVKSNHPEKTIHPCQFPVELVERCVLALTDPGDVVLDPFGGVGSSVIAAIRHGRRGVMAEREPEYVRLAHERIHAEAVGTLRTRPIERAVHQPTGKEKIAQPPPEWAEDDLLP
jgi:DNA modification methylase